MGKGLSINHFHSTPVYFLWLCTEGHKMLSRYASFNLVGQCNVVYTKGSIYSVTFRPKDYISFRKLLISKGNIFLRKGNSIFLFVVAVIWCNILLYQVKQRNKYCSLYVSKLLSFDIKMQYMINSYFQQVEFIEWSQLQTLGTVLSPDK